MGDGPLHIWILIKEISQTVKKKKEKKEGMRQLEVVFTEGVDFITLSHGCPVLSFPPSLAFSSLSFTHSLRLLSTLKSSKDFALSSLFLA